MSIAVIVEYIVAPGRTGHRVIGGFNSEEDAQVWLRTTK